MELTYTMQGDYLIPDLTVPESPEAWEVWNAAADIPPQTPGWDLHRMLLNGTLNSHLEEVDRQANEMMERLTRQMAEKQGVTERLKAEDQMQWVQMMNSIRHSAEEVILNDLIYA